MNARHLRFFSPSKLKLFVAVVESGINIVIFLRLRSRDDFLSLLCRLLSPHFSIRFSCELIIQLSLHLVVFGLFLGPLDDHLRYKLVVKVEHLSNSFNVYFFDVGEDSIDRLVDLAIEVVVAVDQKLASI